MTGQEMTEEKRGEEERKTTERQGMTEGIRTVVEQRVGDEMRT